MNRVETLVARVGSQSEVARILGIKQSTVQYWVSKGRIPAKWHSKIIDAGKSIGLIIDPLELQPGRASTNVIPAEASSHDAVFAKWRGQIDLGGDELDVYVLNTGQRVISIRAAVRYFSLSLIHI